MVQRREGENRLDPRIICIITQYPTILPQRDTCGPESGLESDCVTHLILYVGSQNAFNLGIYTILD